MLGLGEAASSTPLPTSVLSQWWSTTAGEEGTVCPTDDGAAGEQIFPMLSPGAPTQSQAALSNRGAPHSEPNSQNLGCRGSRPESASLWADLCTPIQQPHESLHFPREDASEGMGRVQGCLEKPFHLKSRGGIKCPSYNSSN